MGCDRTGKSHQDATVPGLPLRGACPTPSGRMGVTSLLLGLWDPASPALQGSAGGPGSSHTCAVEWAPTDPPPAHLGLRDASGPTTKQHCAAQGRPDAGHGWPQLRSLAPPQLQLAEGHAGQASGARTSQPSLYEGQVRGLAIQEVDQVVESAVAHPGVVLQPCR